MKKLSNKTNLLHSAFPHFVGAANTWAIDCSSGLGVSEFITAEEAIMVVSSNQIVISATVDRIANYLTFFYAEPEDLGRGGMMLTWANFSTEKKTASAKQVEEDKMQLTWKGLFDTTKREYVWSQDSDYVLYANKQKAWLTNCAEN